MLVRWVPVWSWFPRRQVTWALVLKNTMVQLSGWETSRTYYIELLNVYPNGSIGRMWTRSFLVRFPGDIETAKSVGLELLDEHAVDNCRTGEPSYWQDVHMAIVARS